MCSVPVDPRTVTAALVQQGAVDSISGSLARAAVTRRIVRLASAEGKLVRCRSEKRNVRTKSAPRKYLVRRPFFCDWKHFRPNYDSEHLQRIANGGRWASSAGSHGVQPRRPSACAIPAATGSCSLQK